MNAAVVKLAEAAEKGPRARGGREPLKVLGKHPRTEAEIKLMEGRYGAYVTDGTTNATLPKSIEKRSEEHTSELQSLMRISYAVFCLKKKNNTTNNTHKTQHTQIKTSTYH